MTTPLGLIESQFADIVWENAPLTTRRLVELCEEKINWKRTTTYTVLSKLCKRGLFNMEKRMVTVLRTKEEFLADCCESFVDRNLGGSLPAFLAAFSANRALSEADVQELKAMIADFEARNK